MRVSLPPAVRSAATWIFAIALGLFLGKVLQWTRDGDAPPRASVAPAVAGVEAGRPAVLYFWAKWCGVCRAERPVIDSLEATLAGKPSCGKVVALEDATARDAFAKYGVRVLPTMVVIDAEGRVSKRFLGYTTKWQLVSALESAGGGC